MKNILILTYYYPPCQGVPSFRPSAWSKDFSSFGFKPTIITRIWKGKENKWEDYLVESKGKIQMIENQISKTIYLPYKKSKILRLTEKKWIKVLYLHKLIFLYLAMIGNFQQEVNAYHCMKKYVYDHLKVTQYKLIIVTSPPLNLIRLAHDLNIKFNIPFIVDFQDSWNNSMLADNYKPRYKERFYNYLQKYYLKKWLKRSSLITTVTPAISNFIKKTTNSPIKIITNGFEKDAYNSINVKPSNSLFNVSVMGTIHPFQDISDMLEGITIFLKNKNPEKIKFNFIGIESFPEITKKIKNKLPNDFIYTSPRVSMEEAIKHTLSAHILLFPSYKGYKDYYTAKIFEYLGAGRNILMIPANKDIVDDLILKTNSGKIADSAIEFSSILELWYKEWQATGTVKYYGIKDNINQYSRENQNRLLCEAIKEHILL
jgi:hypothetical protein